MSFNQGLVTALSAGKIWNAQENPPKVYIGEQRIHHYQVGIALFIAAIFLKSPTLAGIGTGLFLDDVDDVPI